MYPCKSFFFALGSSLSTQGLLDGGFTTFLACSRYLGLDTTSSLASPVQKMACADCGMNTDLNTVFVKLFLPLAKRHEVKPKDMIKRLFIVSGMQFEECHTSDDVADVGGWKTGYDETRRGYRDAG